MQNIGESFKRVIWLLEWIQHSSAKEIKREFPKIQDTLGIANDYAFYSLLAFSSKNEDLSRDLLCEATQAMFLDLKIP